MKFCEVCGLFSRSPINLNKKEIYVCKCATKTKSSELKFCSECNLYLHTSIETYRCKCGSPKKDAFFIPKIEADLEAKSKYKSTKKKKSKKKSKK